MAAATGDLLRSQFPGMSLVVADSATTAIEQAASDDWLRIFVDLCVPGACGLSLLRAFKKLGVVSSLLRRHSKPGRSIRRRSQAHRSAWLHPEELHSCGIFPVRARHHARRAGFSSVVRRPEPRVPQLTSRQLAVLQLVAQGTLIETDRARAGDCRGHGKESYVRAVACTERLSHITQAARGLELGLVETVAACE